MEIDLSHTDMVMEAVGSLRSAQSPSCESSSSLSSSSLICGSAVRPTELSLRNIVHPILGSHLPTNARATQRSHCHPPAILRNSNSSSYNQSFSLKPSLLDNASTATENESSLHSRSYNSHSETMEKIRQEKLRLAQLEFQRRQQEKEQKLHDAECREKIVRERKENLLKEKQKEIQRLNEEKRRQVIERRRKQEEAEKAWREQVLQRTQQVAQKRASCMSQTPTSGVWSTKRSKQEEPRMKSQCKIPGHHPVAFGSSSPRTICEPIPPSSARAVVEGKRRESTLSRPCSGKSTLTREIATASRKSGTNTMFQSLYMAPSTKSKEFHMQKSATWTPKQSPRAPVGDSKAKSFIKSPVTDKRRVSHPAGDLSVKNTNPKRPLSAQPKSEKKPRDISLISKSTYNPSPKQMKLEASKHDSNSSPKRDLGKRSSLPMSTSTHAFTRNKDVEEESPTETVDELLKYRAKMAEVRRLAAERREMARKVQETPKIVPVPEIPNAIPLPPALPDEPKSVSSEQSNKESAFFGSEETGDSMSLMNSDTDYSTRSDDDSLSSSGMDVTVPLSLKQQTESSHTLTDSIYVPSDTPLASMNTSLISTGTVAEEQKVLEQQEREERKRKVLSIMSRVKIRNTSNSPVEEPTAPDAGTQKLTRADSLPVESEVSSPMTTSAIPMSPADNSNAETRRKSEAGPITTPTTQFKSALLQNLLANRRLSAGAHITPSQPLCTTTPVANSAEQALTKEVRENPISSEEIQTSSLSSDDAARIEEVVPSRQSDLSASPSKTLPNIMEERPEEMIVVEVDS